ncbi:hypothetical protein [Yoonia maritima]|uniref:hypothetical protein n=1 Tax=Yoonia maritima TaxID=1435347 RepID=UPI000D0FC8CD|nr:hypothetical protein [Yoonia maritima]
MARRSQSGSTTGSDGLTQFDRMALGLSVGWLVIVGLFFVILPPGIFTEAGFDSLRFMMLLVAVFMPVAMIAVVAVVARAQRVSRDEAFRMQAALDAMRQTRVSQPAPQRPAAAGPSATARRQPPEMQAPLTVIEAPVEPAPPTQQLSHIDLVRALNFPDNEEDVEGFAALRCALRDPDARQIVQSSQDVLTLLSQDGIYMDDLHAEPTHPDLWRRFAKGERGEGIAGLGGVNDPAHLVPTAKRMTEDTIFRDSMSHFLRRFDQTVAAFEINASDDDLLALAETRTARAFMLLARVKGSFE